MTLFKTSHRKDVILERLLGVLPLSLQGSNGDKFLHSLTVCMMQFLQGKCLKAVQKLTFSYSS